KLFRAGFEPLRGCTTPPGLERPENDHILGDATRRHGSNSTRSSQRSGIRFPAPRSSPHRVVGPISPFRPKTPAQRRIPQFTVRYNRWPELDLHQTVTFLWCPAICDRKGCETFFVVAGVVTVQSRKPVAWA